MELGGIGIVQAIRFQFDDDMTFQYPMIEDKVCLKIAVVNQHFLLTLLKAEAHTKLQDKVLKMGDEGCLQVRLFHYILGLQTQKLKGKWRLDVKGERICLSLAFHQLRQRLRLLTPSTAEIIVGINLALQFSDTTRPSKSLFCATGISFFFIFGGVLEKHVYHIYHVHIL